MSPNRARLCNRFEDPYLGLVSKAANDLVEKGYIRLRARQD
jgi:hypothetical protein